MTVRVLVPLAEGFEEIEAITVIDVLRRAGAEVTVAGQGGGAVRASRGVRVLPDRDLEGMEDEEFDAVVLPGGMPGATHLAENGTVRRLLEDARRRDRWIGAICAAPAVVLEPMGLLKDRRATCHPSFVGQLERYEAARVVLDGKIVTSQGPGTALEFSLALVEQLFGPEKAAELRRAMCVAMP